MIKELIDFPGYYADTSGKIYSKRRGIIKELTQHQKTYGYYYVTLFKDGKRYYKRVHRLIAETFIPNPKNLTQVNHLDENKGNNDVDNLCWCSPSDNLKYGTRRERVARKVSNPNIQRKNNTSGRKGVRKTKYNTWVAYFNREYLGTFKTFDDAVKVRENAEKTMYGDFS